MRPVVPDPISSSQPARAHSVRCLRCGSTAGLHYVHGHAQCATCCANVEECCQGANCDLAAAGADNDSATKRTSG